MRQFAECFMDVQQRVLEVQRKPAIAPDSARVLVDWIAAWEGDQSAIMDKLLAEMVQAEVEKLSLWRVLWIKARAWLARLGL